MRVQTDKLTLAQVTEQVHAALAKAYDVPDDRTSAAPFVGPSWGADVSKKALAGPDRLPAPGRRW